MYFITRLCYNSNVGKTVNQYVKALERELAHGRTTEHTHRPALKVLVESLQPVLEIESKLDIKFTPDEESDLRMTCGPEDVFAYIYAVLNCPSYQSRYNDLLKLDFPRICLVSDKEQFADLARLGTKLIQAHLMRNSNSSQIRVSFPVSGDNIVAASAPRFTDIDSQSGSYLGQPRIYINQIQYFETFLKMSGKLRLAGIKFSVSR